MRLVFAGTPAFAAEALEALAGARHDIPLVLSQPDRPAGRGLRKLPSAVAQAADRLGLKIAKPTSLRDAAAAEEIRSAGAEVIVVAAYGLILPPAILELVPRGCLNIHASLLPRWRGAAPVHRALLAGDTQTGITIMRMDEGLDTGPMLLRKAVSIDDRDTTGTLTAKLAALGASAIVEALDAIDALAPQPQDPAFATYAAKVAKSEAQLDWRSSNVELDRRVRAFNPAPGAEAQLGGESIKVWEAQPVAGTGEPGSILSARDDDLRVACGSGALRLHVVQRPGGRKLGIADFLRGKPLVLPIRI